MTKPITTSETHEAWDDPLVAAIRPDIRDAIERALQVELTQALGAERYDRIVERFGYRNGTVTRELGTPLGAISVRVPRGRVETEAGEVEWRTTKLRRYARRLQGIDQAMLSIYLSGTNQRKIAVAVRPLLKGLALSKSAVSRLTGQLRAARETWLTRDLSPEALAYLFLDGFVVPVRRDGRVHRTPILVAVGVRETGEKVLLALRVVAGETTTGWQAVLADLSGRGLRPPRLCIIDGSLGLRAAVVTVWPDVLLQRCAVHKLRNLLAHAPQSAHADVRDSFHRIVYASSAAEAQRAYAAFVRRWRSRCAAVARSLEEAGPELLTFFRFPVAQWKSLRSTNVIERIHGELRRRIKTQGAWADEEALLTLLYGLFAAGLIRLRRIDGWKTIARGEERQAA
jgi:transposase-like protein